MANLNKKIKKIYRFIKDAESSIKETIKIGLLGNKNYFKYAKSVLGPDPLNSITELPDASYISYCDLLIVLVNKASEVKAQEQLILKSRIPTILVVNDSNEFIKEDFVEQIEQFIDLKNVVFIKEEDFAKKLRKRILNELTDKELAAARLFPTLRREVADTIISSTSNQNALIAVAFFLPGSDMPLMSLNQAKMVIEIAAIHGEEMSIKRAKEILATIASGYALRGTARQLIGFIPSFGFALRIAVAFGGTKSLGALAVKYFENETNIITPKTTD